MSNFRKTAEGAGTISSTDTQEAVQEKFIYFERLFFMLVRSSVQPD